MKHIINEEVTHIDWDRGDLIDKHDSGCANYTVWGIGSDDKEYVGNGSYQHGDLVDVTEIELAS